MLCIGSGRREVRLSPLLNFLLHHQNDRENEDSCNKLSAAWRAVLVFLIGQRLPGPLPAAVARRASVGRRRGFCTPD